MVRKTRAEMLLEENHPDMGAVETGFNFRIEAIDDPARVLLEILGRKSGDGMRVWFENDQFLQFVATALRVVPLEDAMALFQERFGVRPTD